MSKSIKRVTMTDYNQVKEVASFAYITTQGKAGNIDVHKTTFISLMNNTWDIEEFGEPMLFLRDLKEAVSAEIKTNHDIWFSKEANAILEKRTKDGGVIK